MKLDSIIATQHWFDGEVNGPPLVLLFQFEDFRSLKLRSGRNGFTMLVEFDPLDEPLDMQECGKTEVVEVSQSLFPLIAGADVSSIESMFLGTQQVGIKLVTGDGHAYYIWNQDDELGWGNESEFSNHPWQDGDLPKVGGRIPI